MMNSNAEKGWRAALDSWFDSKALNIHTSFPAVIVAVNSNNTVDVLPLIKTKLSDGSQKPYNVIPDVRVQIASAKRGSVYMSFPLAVNDNVWVFVSERDIVNTMSGDGLTAQDSTTLKTHDLSDCFCIPAFTTDNNTIPQDSENIVISNKNTKITIKESEVLIETTSYKVVANDIKFESSTLTHNGVNIGKDHKHEAGTYVAGATPVTQKSGAPEQ